MALELKNAGRNFPTVKMTRSEYAALPDWSICYPKERVVGDVGKIPELSMPGERLIQVVMKDCIQICYCEFEGS